MGDYVILLLKLQGPLIVLFPGPRASFDPPWVALDAYHRLRRLGRVVKKCYNLCSTVPH